MNVGFTGSRLGMTDEQARRVTHLLIEASESHGDEFHHGDCIGADEYAALRAWELGYSIVAHPASDVKPVLRANSGRKTHALVLAPQPALLRNHAIVDACDVLIAAPSGSAASQPRSGTWATIRYAQRNGVRVALVMPDASYNTDYSTPLEGH